MKHRRDRDSLSRVGLILIAIVLTLVPLLSLLSTALQEEGSVASGLAWPTDPQWHNFVAAFDAANMLVLLKSSAVIVIGVVPISILIGSMAGFGLAHLRLPGRTALLALFLVGLTIPFEALITPLYFLIRDLGVLNTRWAVILPLIGLHMPFAVYWMWTAFRSVPEEITEAARLDGANNRKLFTHVHVPLVMPAVSSLSIILFLWTWNQFLLPLVLVQDPEQRTMAGALGAFQGQHSSDQVLLSAGTLIIMLPTLVIFLLFQRQFGRALLAGAGK